MSPTILAAADAAETYLAIRMLAAPIVLTYVALREHRYGLGDTRKPMVASIAGNLVNVALAYVLLIALPLRAYATIVGPRLGTSPWRLTGRNRQDDEPDEEHPGEDAERPLLSPLLVVVATFAGAALIATLSGGVAAEVRYIRLMAAIGLGLVLLNLLAVVVPARIAGHVLRAPARARLLPGILIVALFAALLSRFLDLQPPVLLGVLLACLALEPARLRARGGVAIAQIAGVATLSLLAWAAHTLLTPTFGFWETFAAETMAAIALGGFGSLLLLLLPIGGLPGRELYAISRGGWAVVALTSASITGAIVASGASFPLLALGLIALGIAAVLTGSRRRAIAYGMITRQHPSRRAPKLQFRALLRMGGYPAFLILRRREAPSRRTRKVFDQHMRFPSVEPGRPTDYDKRDDFETNFGTIRGHRGPWRTRSRPK